MCKKLMKVKAAVREGEIANLMIVLGFPPAAISNPPTSTLTPPYLLLIPPPHGVAGARGLLFPKYRFGGDDSAKTEWPDVGHRDADSAGYFSRNIDRRANSDVVA